MARLLSYADAVRLLGGENSKVVAALDKISGGVLLGAATVAPAALGLFDAKAEVVRLSHELVRGLSERRSGLSRYDRTQRLYAAHTVIVVTAYFEALAEADLPFRFADLELTKAEQVAIAGGRWDEKDPAAWLVAARFDLFWGPQHSHETFLGWYTEFYTAISNKIGRFVRGLAVWDRLSETERDRFDQAVEGVPGRALVRYEELLRRLAADFPEVGWWVSLREHQATRAEVRVLGTALARVERMLADISSGRVPDERRASLARAYRAALAGSVVDSGDIPAGLRMPTLEEAYVPPLFRVADVRAGTKASEELWWSEHPVRDDIEEFLTGYLTAPQASEAPLVVLGQPGSGKSVLTKVLAARLPPADFLPVRVVLREVPATSDLQDQIEYAIRAATGERLDWPALARSAGGALPVVLLDGFDELLQATGASQSDYLTKVAAFQRREADQGRPVAVVVTSRTSVADRARTPEGTVALRLEPFDDERVSAWLETWNGRNAAHFSARGLVPLTPQTVLAHRELAEQPLLLLMLALYDSDGNALHRAAADLRRSDLYEQLLRSFARREVTKHQPNLSDRDLDRAVEDELRRLSVVGFAMFNRGSQWVTEADLESDLPALFGRPQPPAGTDLRAALRPAEIVLGRFFFIHRAQASRDDARLETYEFLHATFGEFLVARLTWQVLRNMLARQAASTLSFGAEPADDDLLHALLSFAVLTVRRPVVEFLAEMSSTVDESVRDGLTDLLVRLFQVVHQPRHAGPYEGYQPRRLPVPARYAAYSANLVVLAVIVAGTIRASDLYGPEADVVAAWHSQALLWRSQLTAEEWDSLFEALELDRTWAGDRRDLVLARDDGGYRAPAVDTNWTFNRPPSDSDRTRYSWANSNHHHVVLRREAYFQCGINEDVVHHTLEPFGGVIDDTVNTFVGWSQGTAPSAAHLLLDAWLLPLRNPTDEERRTAYERCTQVANRGFEPGSDKVVYHFVTLLLDRLATDYAAPPELVTNILFTLVEHDARLPYRLQTGSFFRCVLNVLGRDSDTDRTLAALLGVVLRVPPADFFIPNLVELMAQTLARLAELELPLPTLRVNEFDNVDLIEAIRRQRRELADRILSRVVVQRR